MPSDWTNEAVVTAVRSRLCDVSAERDGFAPAHVALDAEDILVTFRWRGDSQLYGVRFALADVPTGPSTGEVCESPDAWAQEVSWVLDEEIGTGLVQEAHRTVTPDGLVLLRWRNGSDAL